MEVRGDTAVFTFGRFNPPTIGHEKLIDALAGEQKKNPGAPMYVFPSHSNDPKRNPLPHALKVAYMKKMFRKYSKYITVSSARNIFEVATFLQNKGHRAVIMVVGSDRVAEFTRLLNEYNGVQGKHGYYDFDNIEVKSAGERDPDAEGVAGMSASKMRTSAVEGDYDSFKQGLPSGFKDGERLFRDVRKNMGLREERMMGELDFYEEIRDDYLTGKIWNVGDIVEANGLSGEIVRKGTNYISFMTEDGKVHKAWLSDVRLDEMSWFQRASSKIDQMRHPRGYDNLVKKYVQIIKDKGGTQVRDASSIKINNPSSIASEIAQEVGLSPRVFVEYINKLVKKGVLPKELKAEYQIENDDSFTSLVLQMEKLRRVKQDPDVEDSPGTEPAKYFAKGAGGKELAKSTKQARARHFDKKAKMSDDDPRAYEPAPGDVKLKTKQSKHTKKFKQMFGEQPEHEITVGNYTTKFFYMCGSAQKVMKKNADVEGAEEITKLQDDFYKLEKDVMDAGSATDGQKILAKEIYNKIMRLAGEAELADDIGGYMKQHLDSVEKGDPKPGFGRTDMKEEVDPADVDDDATELDVKAADKNIMMQMRKVISLRGNFKVEFGDKKKMKLPPKIAQAVQKKYNSIRRPADKQKFTIQVSKSYKDMLDALKEDLDEWKNLKTEKNRRVAGGDKRRTENKVTVKETKLSSIHRQLREK